MDQPLLIGEGLRRNAFPQGDPPLMAAITAAFVSEKESDERVEKVWLPKPLLKAIAKLRKTLNPLVKDMMDKDFQVRPLSLRPAAAVYAWAAGHPWDKALAVADSEEGILASLILRTADNLRHIKNLRGVFPEASKSAAIAIDLILRDPVALYY